tara:strand:+ start:1566 stop:2942 length:1377 start_codon:yes stop_codon:yes gene_type:complete
MTAGTAAAENFRPGTYRLSLISPVVTEHFLVTSRQASAYRARQGEAAVKLQKALKDSYDVLIPETPHEAATASRGDATRPTGWTDFGGRPRTPYAFVRLVARKCSDQFEQDGLTARCVERWYNIHDFGVLVFCWTFEIEAPEGASTQRLRAFADWLAETALPEKVSGEARDLTARVEKALPDLTDKKVRDQIEHLDDATEWNFSPVSVHRVWSFSPDAIPQGGFSALRPLVEVSTVDGFQPVEVGPQAHVYSGYMNSVVVAPEDTRGRYSPEPLIAYYGYTYATMLLLDERLFFASERFLKRTTNANGEGLKGNKARQMRERLNIFRDMTTFFLHRHHDELGVIKPFERRLWSQLMSSWRFEALASDLERKRDFLNEIYDQAAQRAQERLAMITNVVFGVLTSLTLVSVIGDLAWFFRGDVGESLVANEGWRWIWAGSALGATALGVLIVFLTRSKNM